MDPSNGHPASWHGYHRSGHTVTTQLALFESASPHGPWGLFYLEQVGMVLHIVGMVYMCRYQYTVLIHSANTLC
jgi:hypothetical protein